MTPSHASLALSLPHPPPMEMLSKDTPDGPRFYARCTKHNWFYKGLPPITHGCAECWQVYYVMSAARSGNIELAVEQLEPGIRHAAEQIEAGTWDLELLDRPEINIEKDAEN